MITGMGDLKTPGTLRHLASILVLPGTVTLAVPAVLLLLSWKALAIPLPTWARIVGLVAGAGFAALGLVLVVATVRLFARVGRGTLAPWDPTRHLVVEGPFRYVRNPMISGVMLVLLGEALALASPALFGWFAVFTVANAVYLPRSEEPGLLERFGDAYRAYRDHVPRWIPRRTPWTPPERTDPNP